MLEKAMMLFSGRQVGEWKSTRIEKLGREGRSLMALALIFSSQESTFA